MCIRDRGKSYLVTALSFELKPKWWRVFYPGIGVDVFYDRATHDEQSVFGNEPYKTIDDFKSGFHFTQELVYNKFSVACLLYTSDAADERSSVDLGGRR